MKNKELTKLYPMVQFKRDTWEIDEFDCASLFLLIGSEKAMLIDTGMGIGDLRGAVEMITDKPLIVVHSHGHVDHTGNSRQFEEIWLHPADQHMPIPDAVERRIYDTERITARQKGSIGAPYNLFNLYGFDLSIDLRDPVDDKVPIIHDLYDGQQFDLGNRTVTVFECPGHTAGEVVFLDSKTRSLFAGDAINFNLGINSGSAETALKYLKRIKAMEGQYDGIYNGHHDFRALGMPLDDDCLENLIAILEDALKGNVSFCECPSFWGQPMPLTRKHPEAESGNPYAHKHVGFLRRGRNFLRINPDSIFDK